MGSLDGGVPITQPTNKLRLHHQGNFIQKNDTKTDSKVESIPSTGHISLDFKGDILGLDTIGVVFTPISDDNVHTSGLSLVARTSSTSVEREKYTTTGVASGDLTWEYTRKIDGIQTSVSTVNQPMSANAPETVTERKLFFLDSDRGKTSGLSAWKVFDADGFAVGATTGITDIDVSPAATFDGKTDEPPV